MERSAHAWLVRVVWVVALVMGSLVFGLVVLASGRSSVPSVARPLTFDSPIGDPHLALDKRVDNESPEPNDEIVYTLVYSTTEVGSQAFNVRLYDFLPAGVTFLSATPAEVYFEDGVLMFTDDSAGWEEESITVRVRVLGGQQYLVNHALVMADGVTPTHASLLTNVGDPGSLADLLRVSKWGPGVVLAGDGLVYTIHCENIASVAVNQVQIADVLPTGISVVGVDPIPDHLTLPLIEWSVAELPPGAVWTGVITTTSSPDYLGALSNTALASGQGAVMTQTLFTTHVVTAVLHVTQTTSVPWVHLGDSLVYTLTYWHDGGEPVAWATLTDTLPADVTVVGLEPAPLMLTSERAVWEIDDLGVGEVGQVVIEVQVNGDRDRTLCNQVDISGPANTWPDRVETFVKVMAEMYLPLALRE